MILSEKSLLVLPPGLPLVIISLKWRRRNIIIEGNDVEDLSYCSVGRLTSGVNHRWVVWYLVQVIPNNKWRCSCMPDSDVGVNFDIPTFSLEIIARRDIATLSCAA